MRLLLVILLLFSSNLFAAEMSTEKMPKHDWSFKGVTGTFDRALSKVPVTPLKDQSCFGIFSVLISAANKFEENNKRITSNRRIIDLYLFALLVKEFLFLLHQY